LKEKYRERRIFLAKLSEAKIDYLQANYRPNKYLPLKFEDVAIGQKVRFREYLLTDVEGVVVENLETIIKVSYMSRIYNQEKAYWLLFDSDLLLSPNNL